MRVTIERIRDEIGDRLEVVTAWAYGATGGRSGQRQRMAGAAIFALCLHALLFWSLVANHPRDMQLPTWEEPPMPVELLDVPPPEPEVQPEPKPVVTVEHPIDQPQPEAQPEAEPVPEPK
ncbi:MAG: hypothetical protein JF615_16500, partial [Asticcacaulis sp.]|nr:hypothetical protein [Asticcacaulis sp.]